MNLRFLSNSVKLQTAAILGAATALALLSLPTTAGDTWRGLSIAAEHRCSPYNKNDYGYSQSLERTVIASMRGRIYGPYTGTHFKSHRDTDIEHIVARSEAHDSGLCSADPATRGRFANDPLNLTLAAPAVNRCGSRGKCAHDAAAWLPDRNRCWFASRVVQVRKKYRLTIDHREATSLEQVLSQCASTQLIFYAPGAAAATVHPRASESRPSADDPLRRWDDNRNGRITCAEARRHGIAPVQRAHPAYRYMFDADRDGIVCE